MCDSRSTISATLLWLAANCQSSRGWGARESLSMKDLDFFSIASNVVVIVVANMPTRGDNKTL